MSSAMAFLHASPFRPCVARMTDRFISLVGKRSCRMDARRLPDNAPSDVSDDKRNAFVSDQQVYDVRLSSRWISTSFAGHVDVTRGGPHDKPTAGIIPSGHLPEVFDGPISVETRRHLS